VPSTASILCRERAWRRAVRLMLAAPFGVQVLGHQAGEAIEFSSSAVLRPLEAIFWTSWAAAEINFAELAAAGRQLDLAAPAMVGIGACAG